MVCSSPASPHHTHTISAVVCSASKVPVGVPEGTWNVGCCLVRLSLALATNRQSSLGTTTESTAVPPRCLGLILKEIFKIVKARPEEPKLGPHPFSCLWELLACAAVIGLLSVPLLLWVSFQSVRGWIYRKGDKKLAQKCGGLTEEKCKLPGKDGLVQEEHDGLESSLKDASFKNDSAEAQSLSTTCELLARSKSKVEEEILFLERTLKEEKCKHYEQDTLLSELSKREQGLENVSKFLNSQLDEAQTTFNMLHINHIQLKDSVTDTLNKNSQLEESLKQLAQEVEVWKQQVKELNKEKITVENSNVQAEKVLNDKENDIRSLTESLLKMEDWDVLLEEDMSADGNLKLKSEAEIGACLDQHQGALKKLLYAVHLSASLQALERERKQIYTQLSKVHKTNANLTEHIKYLQIEKVSFQCLIEHFERENPMLQQRFKTLADKYQEKGTNLYRRLIAEENVRLVIEEKVSQVEKQISYISEDLSTYRKLAGELELKMKKTIHYYQRQVISYKKKVCATCLAAENAEKNLQYFRKLNACKRQKLAEMKLRYEILEKDPLFL